jgi:hypothetical protein
VSERENAILLRKHLLVMRSAVERAELAKSVQNVRRGLAWTSLLKAAVPGVAASQGLPMLMRLIGRYPLIATAARILGPRVRSRGSVVGIVRWAVVAALLWQGWQIVRLAPKTRRRAPVESEPD